MVLEAGLEPAQPNGQGILSPSCLPFHHSSILLLIYRDKNNRGAALRPQR